MTSPLPSSIAALLAALLREPGRPRVTWYGDDGERIELSGAVLDNWVSKTTNLLVEEFDAGPGSGVRIDLPVHWRTLVWALAAWRCGASVLLDDDADPAVLVTDDPARHPDATEPVAVALPALSRSWTGAPLPSGAVDAAQAVMTYGDVIGWAPPTDPAAEALPGTRFDELIAAPVTEAGARTLLVDAVGTHFLRTALAVLAGGGSVVLAPGATGERAERIVTAEQVTARA